MIIRGATISKTLRIAADGELFCVEERSFEQGKEEGYKKAQKEGLFLSSDPNILTHL